ncbi:MULTISPECIES: DUF1737 domain-containing protein [Winogradskyella]|nr:MULTISPECIES: DUF1737 domain-containing protein [Winogradskyella]QXP78305.1 DUF1737 domain-containing protein [Winogradskyella sp. HaHa_3_26]
MEYKIIKVRHIDMLAASVNEAIQNGWQPQGGVGETLGGEYFQPMIKE